VTFVPFRVNMQTSGYVQVCGDVKRLFFFYSRSCARGISGTGLGGTREIRGAKNTVPQTNFPKPERFLQQLILIESIEVNSHEPIQFCFR